MGEENSRCGIFSNAEMVVENILDELIAGLVLVVMRDMLKSLVDRYKESIVLIGAV